MRHVTIAAVLVLAGVGAGGCESAIEAACHDGGEAATAWWSLEDLAREDVAFVGRVTGVSGASVDTIPEGTTAPYRRTTMAVDRLLWDDDEGVGPVGGDVVLRDDGCSGGPPRGSTWLVVAGPRGADDLTSSFGRQARWRVDGAGIATNGSHPELTGVPVDHVVATLLALRPSPPVG